MSDPSAVERITAGQQGYLPGHLALEWEAVGPGRARGGFTAGLLHMAPNGFLHAASVIALADTACGYGCVASLPDGAQNFTTVELKANFLGTARQGDRVTCEARLIHGGRTTQVWDAEARVGDGGKPIALFRCTQMLLYPKPA